MQKLLLLALTGIAGTLGRYWMSGFLQHWCGTAFPWSTLIINALGCLFFGFFWTLGERLIIHGETRVIILTGFLGTFTTYSTFAFETAQQLRRSQWLDAAANVGAEVGLGVACVFVGFALGRWLPT